LHATPKLLVTLIYLICVATLPVGSFGWIAAYGAAPAPLILAARLPAGGVLARAAVVLPFAAAFAVASWISGDAERAATLLLKSYISGVAVLLLMATTQFTDLLRSFERLGAPRILIVVVQFVYRYLFVVSEQAQHMWEAARSRAGRFSFRGAGGAVAVLFIRSAERAEAIHRAMLARCYTRQIHTLHTPSAHWSHWLLCVAAAGGLIAARWFL
jgi:cobalt/nickel transport system permease protein